MEALRNKRDRESDSDFQSLHKNLNNLSDISLENYTAEEMCKDVESPDDKEDNYKVVSSDVEIQRLFEPENMTITCANSESTSSNKTLELDVIMISPPQVKRIPSQDVQSDTANIHLDTPRGDTTNIMLNTKALPKEARTYELEKFKKNCLIIFNQTTIIGFKPRHGTEQDVIALTGTFRKFGFEVVEHKDFTKDEIIEVLETFKTTNFTEYGCVGVVVLTHGSGHGLLRAKDEQYSETVILRYLQQQPTLVTKPKLLMIQACRGTRCLPGVQVQRLGNLSKDADEEVEPYTLPAMSDVLIAHSSYVGEVSIRDDFYGSWFIQTICSKINEMSPTHDLESILTGMKREVATDRYWEESIISTGETDICKQMPTVTSTLIRKLYLRKFGDASPHVTLFNTATPSTLAGPFLDTAITPLLDQLEPCSCFLDHFDYIKRCLAFFVEENPNDASARAFLNISNAFGNEHQLNDPKEVMAKAICEHLNHNARHCDFFKYLYLYKHSAQ